MSTPATVEADGVRTETFVRTRPDGTNEKVHIAVVYRFVDCV